MQRSMISVYWVCAAVVLLVNIELGSGQGEIFCSNVSDCSVSTPLGSERECCILPESRSFATAPGAEGCVPCYVFGFVKNVSNDLTSADPQTEIIQAAEGDEIILTLFFSKNDPPITDGFLFDIQLGGTAIEGEDMDYTISAFDDVPMRINPTTITVTLRNDGVTGEVAEEITLTLIQDSRTPSRSNQFLVYDTVRISFLDNDIETGFGERMVTITESDDVPQICLVTIGVPAVDTPINVTLIPGTASIDDFELVTSQVTITTTNPEPCVEYKALADDLALEGDETLILSLSAPENVQLGIDTVTITIQDADVVTFGFFESDNEGNEKDGVLNVSISRSVSTANDISLNFTTTEYDESFGFMDDVLPFNPDSPNLATPGADYVTDPVIITIPAGSGNVPAQLTVIDDDIAEETEQYFIGILSFIGDSTGAILGQSISLLAVVDDDNEIIGFVSPAYTVEESDDEKTIYLTLNKSLESENTYTVRVRGISVTAEDEDYVIPVTTLSFPPDATTLMVPVTILNDTRIELREQFDVTVRQEGGVNFAVDFRNLTSVFIDDNDGNYLYEPKTGMVDIPEGETRPITFILLNPPEDGIFDFDYDVSFTYIDNTAINETDYVVLNVSVPASMQPNGTVQVEVTAINDSVVEFTETFYVSGEAAPPGVPVVFSEPAEVSILSEDVALLSFEEQEYFLQEGGIIEVCLADVTEPLEAPITVQLSLVNSTDIEGDIIAEIEPLITFGSEGLLGSGDLGMCIVLEGLQDRLTEPSESYAVMGEIVSNAELARFVGANPVAAILVDTTVNVNLEQLIYQTSESAGFVEVCFFSSDIILFPFNITLATTAQSATDGLDYSGVSTTYTMSIDQPFICEVITILPDNLVEMQESFLVGISSDAAFVSITNDTAVVNIAREFAVIGFEQGVYPISEMDASVNVCVDVRNGFVDYDLEVNIDILPTSTATEGQDYEVNTSVITIPALITRGCLTVEILASAVVEGEEEIHMRINETTTVALIVDGETVVAIAADGVVMVGFAALEYCVIEGDEFELLIQKIGRFESDITVEVLLGTTPVELITFPAGGPSSTNRTYTGQTFDDNIALQPNARLIYNLTLVNPDPQVVLFNPQTSVIVMDDDGPVVVGFTSVNMTVNEGDGNISVPVALAPDIAGTVTVSFNIISGSAVEGDDYVITGLSSLQFTNNGTMNIPLAILEDGLLEMTESFSIILSNSQPGPPNVQLGIDTIVVFIVDNNIPDIAFEQNEYITSEMESSVEVCVVVMNGNVTSDLAVNIATDIIFSTAVEGEDFSFNGPPVINILTGTNRGCLTINIIASPVVEGREELILFINEQNLTANVLDGDTTVIITSDGVVTIGFAESDYTLIEGGSVMVVVVKSGPIDSEINYIIESPTISPTTGFFLPGPDAPNNSSVEYTASENNIALEPPIVIPLTLSLSSPNPLVVITNGMANITLLDNDVNAIGFDRPVYFATEGEPVDIVITSSNPIATELRYVVDAGPYGAIEGVFPINLNASENSTVTFVFSGDDIALQPPRTIPLTLSIVDQTLPIIYFNEEANVTLLDDDGPVVVGFEDSAIEVSEDAGTILIPVTLTQEIAVSVSVDFSVISGTAMQGPNEDYVRTGLSSLTFTGPGTRTIPISIVNDNIMEDLEFFTIALSNPQPGGVDLGISSIIINIRDDDDVNVTMPPILVNNTIIGDPFYTVPLKGSAIGFPPPISLCYELHGEADKNFNIVNDNCTLVNAHYYKPLSDVDINVIDRVYIRAVDTLNECHNISVSLDQCSVTVDSASVNRSYEHGDIYIRRYPNRIRVSVPNCEKIMFVMYVYCDSGPLPMSGDTSVNMMKIVVARGVSLSEKAHGLLGQMWNVRIDVEDYTGALGVLPEDAQKYYVTIDNTLDDSQRTFIAVLQLRTWDRTPGPCLYAGNRQAGPTGDVPADQDPNGSVIEGVYKDYIITSDYGTDCQFCGQFDDSKCQGTDSGAV